MKRSVLPGWLFDEALKGSRWTEDRVAAMRAYLVDGLAGDEVMQRWSLNRAQLGSTAIQVRAKVADYFLDSTSIAKLRPGQARLEFVADEARVEQLRQAAEQISAGAAGVALSIQRAPS